MDNSIPHGRKIEPFALPQLGLVIYLVNTLSPQPTLPPPWVMLETRFTDVVLAFLHAFRLLPDTVWIVFALGQIVTRFCDWDRHSVRFGQLAAMT